MGREEQIFMPSHPVEVPGILVQGSCSNCDLPVWCTQWESLSGWKITQKITVWLHKCYPGLWERTAGEGQCTAVQVTAASLA